MVRGSSSCQYLLDHDALTSRKILLYSFTLSLKTLDDFIAPGVVSLVEVTSFCFFFLVKRSTFGSAISSSSLFINMWLELMRGWVNIAITASCAEELPA